MADAGIHASELVDDLLFEFGEAGKKFPTVGGVVFVGEKKARALVGAQIDRGVFVNVVVLNVGGEGKSVLRLSEIENDIVVARLACLKFVEDRVPLRRDELKDRESDAVLFQYNLQRPSGELDGFVAENADVLFVDIEVQKVLFDVADALIIQGVIGDPALAVKADVQVV